MADNTDFIDSLNETQALWKEIFNHRFIISVIIVAILVGIWIAASKIFKKATARNGKSQTNTLTKFIFSLFKMLLLFAACLLILQVYGVNVTGAVAGLSIASAVAGLAVQDALRDIIMGIHITGAHFFDIGDVVEYNGTEGMVIDFSFGSTKIRDIKDGTIYAVSNRNISEIRTYPKSIPLLIDIPLPYEESSKKIDAVLENVCDELSENEHVDKCIYKGTQAFGDSAVIYRMHVYCAPAMKFDIQRLTVQKVQKALENADISIPYAQLDIHQKN